MTDIFPEGDSSVSAGHRPALTGQVSKTCQKPTSLFIVHPFFGHPNLGFNQPPVVDMPQHKRKCTLCLEMLMAWQIAGVGNRDYQINVLHILLVYIYRVDTGFKFGNAADFYGPLYRVYPLHACG